MKKIFICILITLIFCSSCNKKDIIDSAVMIDNSDRNIYANDTVFGPALSRTNDTIYFRKMHTDFDYDEFDDVLIQNIYKMNMDGKKKVYEGKVGAAMAFYSEMYVYKDELLDFRLHENAETGNPEIWKLNCDKQEFEKYIELDSPDVGEIYRFFTANNDLYVCSDSEENNVYKYDDGKYFLIASKELFGEEYKCIDYYKNYMYYVTSKNDFEKLTTVYKYDLDKNKTVQEYDLSCLQQILNKPNYGINQRWFVDNYLYLEFTDNGQFDGHHYFYRLDLSNMSMTEIFDSPNSFILNAYGDNAYIGFASENKSGLYEVTPDSDELKELYSGDVFSVFIIDDKWIYFTGNTNTLYRILPNGENLEKIM